MNELRSTAYIDYTLYLSIESLWCFLLTGYLNSTSYSNLD